MHITDAFLSDFTRQYSNYFVRLASKIVASEETAKDIVASALEYIWQNRDKKEFHSTPALINYVTTMVRRECYDFLQKTGRERVVVAEITRTQVGGGEGEPSPEAIDRAIQQLPPKQKEVMEWCMKGKKLVEVAALMGLSPGTVRSYKHKAVRRIRMILSINT